MKRMPASNIQIAKAEILAENEQAIQLTRYGNPVMVLMSNAEYIELVKLAAIGRNTPPRSDSK